LRIAQRHLAVAANGDLHPLGGLAAHTDDGGAVKLLHEIPWLIDA